MTLEETTISEYLNFCKDQKQLNRKTIKAYNIDLHQFQEAMHDKDMQDRNEISSYIQTLHSRFCANTVKRKIACLNAFYNYLVINDIFEYNPLNKIQIRFKQAKQLPRTISLRTLQTFYHSLYKQKEEAKSEHQTFNAIRDIALFELLLGTGMRISEACSLKKSEINFHECYVRINGKGNKERILQIGNPTTFQALMDYNQIRERANCDCPYFFINKLNNRLSEQSVRITINNHVDNLQLQEHITPHMFRHTFATLLLEGDVDIRYIQQILGHSSITTTQIYTHISSNKQKEILNHKNPRNFITID